MTNPSSSLDTAGTEQFGMYSLKVEYQHELTTGSRHEGSIHEDGSRISPRV